MGWLKFRGVAPGEALARSSPENPSTSLSNPASWLYEAFGAVPTHAGARVSEDSALRMAAFWACTEIRAKTLASVGCRVYERLEAGGRRRATDHPSYRLLAQQPNPEMTAMTYHQVIDAHVFVWGNGYAEIERSRVGEPLALWPLLPDRTEPVRWSEDTARKHGSRWGGGKYLKVRLETGAAPPEGYPVANGFVYMPPGSYVHIPGIGYDGLKGYSRVAYHRQGLGLGLAAEEFQARFYGSGMKPGFLLKSDYNIKPEQAEKLRAKLEEWQAGLSQSHRLLMLEKGLGVEKLGMDLNDAQHLESRVHQVEEVARIADMPLHRLKIHKSGGGHNTIEGQQLDFVQGTMLPVAVAHQEAYTSALLDPETHFAEFELVTLLRADVKARGEFYRTLVNIGAMTPNEVRQRENLNPSSDPGADRLWLQMNMAPMGDLVAGELDPPAGPERAALPKQSRAQRQQRSATARWRIQQAQRRLFETAAGRFVRAEVKMLTRLVTKALASSEEFALFYLRELETVYDKFPRQVRNALLPIMLTYAELIADEIRAEVGGDIDADAVEAAASEFVDKYTTRHINSSRGQLNALIEAAESQEAAAESVTQRIGEWAERRPGKVVNRETVRAGGFLARAAYAASGAVVYEVWRHLGGDCGICTAMDGRRVAVGERFVGKGETVASQDEEQADLVSYEPMMHPPAHDGCSNCMVVAG